VQESISKCKKGRREYNKDYLKVRTLVMKNLSIEIVLEEWGWVNVVHMTATFQQAWAR